MTVLWLVVIVFIALSRSREISTSDRISQIVEGRLAKSRGSKASRAGERSAQGERQPLTPKPKNKVTKVIDSYAQQRAKAMKMRANHKSEKKGIRRIG